MGKIETWRLPGDILRFAACPLKHFSKSRAREQVWDLACVRAKENTYRCCENWVTPCSILPDFQISISAFFHAWRWCSLLQKLNTCRFNDMDRCTCHKISLPECVCIFPHWCTLLSLQLWKVAQPSLRVRGRYLATLQLPHLSIETSPRTYSEIIQTVCKLFSAYSGTHIQCHKFTPCTRTQTYTHIHTHIHTNQHLQACSTHVVSRRDGDF